ncbi:MAG: IS4 family transposase [Chloroflexia bacterium]|nr:IS4 family transposase [Chloroflexia bacterium]
MIPVLPACSRTLRRLLTPRIRAAAKTPGVARYRKHFPVTAHCWILVLHVLLASPSLRQTHALLANLPGAFARLGLDRGISLSQLARSSTSRPSAYFEIVLADLIAQAKRTVIADASWRLLRRVQIVDSTFIALSAKLSPWSRHGRFPAGVRLQTALDLGRHLPRQLRLTLTATNDHEALKEWDLEAWQGWTVLIDLGYDGPKQFARLREAGVSFVCRLHPQAPYRITASRAVSAKTTPEGDVVLSDETITLGSPNNRNGTVLPDLRLVRSRNRHGIEQAFVTDRVDLPAFEIVRLSHYRWRIELFFHFLKRQLGLVTPLGHSWAAVWLTVLVVLIVALVLLLLAADRPATISRSSWAHLLGLTTLLAPRGG